MMGTRLCLVRLLIRMIDMIVTSTVMELEPWVRPVMLFTVHWRQVLGHRLRQGPEVLDKGKVLIITHIFKRELKSSAELTWI